MVRFTSPGFWSRWHPRMLRRRRKVVAEIQTRAVNEKVEELLDDAGADRQDPAGFFCECSDPVCPARIEITPARWEALHADRRIFVVVPGHQDREVERVVDSLPGYLVVRKDTLEDILDPDKP